jgi:hypothetical protein
MIDFSLVRRGERNVSSTISRRVNRAFIFDREPIPGRRGENRQTRRVEALSRRRAEAAGYCKNSVGIIVGIPDFGYSKYLTSFDR